jgi:peroxiredoxin family protein
MAFQERIRSSSSRHTQLLQSFQETSYAPSATQQTAAYIIELQSKIPIETKALEKLHWKVSKERSEYEMYRDASLKRFAYKLTGRKEDFDAKVSKEEREYREILEVQTKAKQKLETTKINLEESQRKLLEYETAAAQHAIVKSELTILYASVFESPHEAPHPPYVILQTSQTALARAKAAHAEALKPFDHASQVITHLEDSNKYLTWALNNVANALSSANTPPMTMSVGIVDNMRFSEQALGTEKNAMAQAQALASQAEIVFDQARRMDRDVRVVAKVRLAQGDWLYEGVQAGRMGADGLKKAFNSYRFKEKIKATEADLKKAREEMETELQAARGRRDVFGVEVEEARERLEEAEVGVRKARGEVWKAVAEGREGELEIWSDQGGLDAPPSYAP